jgi:hypothetical protein
MVRVLAALIAMVPVAGQESALFALHWWQGEELPKDQEEYLPGPVQMFKGTVNATSGLLQYAAVGPKIPDLVIKSTITCVDSPSEVYYFVGGKNSTVDCSWRDADGNYHLVHCPQEYNLYGISTATGEKVSEFQLPTPKVEKMLDFNAMEWQLGCDQSGGVLLLGTWVCDDVGPPNGCDTMKPLTLPLWRYNTKKQKLKKIAKMEAYSYGGNDQEQFPASTYGNMAVDLEHGHVSLVFDPYRIDPACDDCEPEGDDTLTVVDMNTGNVTWHAKDTFNCVPGSTECPPSINSQVYDPLKKRFFGCGFAFYPNGPVMQIMNFFFWWDETGILQRILSEDCNGDFATVDLDRRAAIFAMGQQETGVPKVTYVSLDTGEIMYRQDYPGTTPGLDHQCNPCVYLAQQNGAPAPPAPPAPVYKCIDNQCQPASSGVSLDTCSTFCGSAVANSTIVV